MGFMFMFNRVLYSYIAWAVPHSIRNFSSIILLFFLTLISDGHRRNFRVGKIFLFLCSSLTTTVPLKVYVFIWVLQFFCHKLLDKLVGSVFVGLVFVEFGWFFFFSQGFGIRIEEHGYPENLGFRSHKRISIFDWGSW